MRNVIAVMNTKGKEWPWKPYDEGEVALTPPINGKAKIIYYVERVD